MTCKSLENEYNKSMEIGMKKGVVSLYVVIFTTLLLSVISIGFMRIMMGEQRAASNQDLSISAYDSAMAGVEDAKVVVAAYYTCKNLNLPDSATPIGGLNCGRVRRAINNTGNDKCNTIQIARGETVVNNERPLNQGVATDGSAALNQAYTCLIINPQGDALPDYLAELPESSSVVVPLHFDGEVNRIILRWHTADDGTRNVANLGNNNCDDDQGRNCFPNRVNWTNRPPAIRWQLVDGGGSFTLQAGSPVGDSASLNAVNKRATLFFIPSINHNQTATRARVTASGNAVNKMTVNNSTDLGADGGHAPLPVRCSSTFGNNGYSCQVSIDLPNSISMRSGNALMRLTSYYGATSISVEGHHVTPSTTIHRRFEGIQAEIDSTGRAGDLFRRVVTRVDLLSGFPFPEWTLDLTGDNSHLCKNFIVGANSTSPTGASCSP